MTTTNLDPSSLGILHLTDFHQNMGGQRTLWPDVKDRFFQDLDALHETAGPVDLVLFTGDLTQKGTCDEFKKFDETLSKLFPRLEDLGSRPAFLAVPGNHDMTWPAQSPERDALLAWHAKADTHDAFFETPSDPRRSVIDTAFQAYSAWWNGRAHGPTVEIRKGLLPGDFAATVTKGDLKLAVVGLNSAFLQLGSGMSEESLDVSPQQLFGACGEDPPEWLAEHHAALLMTHHPLEWLAPSSQQRFRARINPPNRFVAHLFGHMHEAAVRVVSEGGAPPRRGLQGMSLFGLETFKDAAGERVERLHGYAAMRLSVNGRDGRLTMWPRHLQMNKVAGYERMVPDHERYDLTNESVTMTFTSLRTLSARRPTDALESASMSSSARACVVPSPIELRALMQTRLRTSAKFDAFCLDHFPEVYREFNGGMDRTTRENLLLSSVDHAHLRATLG